MAVAVPQVDSAWRAGYRVDGRSQPGRARSMRSRSGRAERYRDLDQRVPRRARSSHHSVRRLVFEPPRPPRVSSDFRARCGLLRRAHGTRSLCGSARLLSSGTTYWLAVLGKGGAIYFRDRNGRLCTGERSSRRGLRALPRRWPAGPTRTLCRISAYVKGAARASSTAGTSTGGTTRFGHKRSWRGRPRHQSAPLPPPHRHDRTANGIQPCLRWRPARRRSVEVRSSGETLTTSSGSWTDSPTSYAYQWEACDTVGLLCTALGGATASS